MKFVRSFSHGRTPLHLKVIASCPMHGLRKELASNAGRRLGRMAGRGAFQMGNDSRKRKKNGSRQLALLTRASAGTRVGVFGFGHSLKHPHCHDWSAVEVERDQLSNPGFVLCALHRGLNL